MHAAKHRNTEMVGAINSHELIPTTSETRLSGLRSGKAGRAANRMISCAFSSLFFFFFFFFLVRLCCVLCVFAFAVGSFTNTGPMNGLPPPPLHLHPNCVGRHQESRSGQRASCIVELNMARFSFSARQRSHTVLFAVCCLLA